MNNRVSCGEDPLNLEADDPNPREASLAVWEILPFSFKLPERASKTWEGDLEGAFAEPGHGYRQHSQGSSCNSFCCCGNCQDLQSIDKTALWDAVEEHVKLLKEEGFF